MTRGNCCAYFQSSADLQFAFEEEVFLPWSCCLSESRYSPKNLERDANVSSKADNDGDGDGNKIQLFYLRWISS